MKAFTIHQPPDPPAERIDRADSLVFVKEGMSWAALLFAPFWLLVNQLWLAFAGYVVIAALLLAGGTALGIGNELIGWGFAALHLLIGLEADSIWRWSLTRAGWRELGAVTGRTQDDCERTFFDAWLPLQPAIAPRKTDDPGLGANLG